MRFRCPMCQGEFDVRPDASKALVYCSHCGAALQSGQSAPRAIPVASQPIAPTASNTGAPAGYAALADAVAADGGASDDPLSSIASRGVAPVLHAPVRRMHRRKSNSTATIMIISIIGMLVVIVVGFIILLLVNRASPEEPPRKAHKPASQPGELFPGKGS